MANNSDDTEHSCAACGNNGRNLKRCSACKLVFYCDVKCQRKHRKAHKSDCKKRSTERADEQPTAPTTVSLGPECPICMLPLPAHGHSQTYMACCGQTICGACFAEPSLLAGTIKGLRCNFCRSSIPKTHREQIKQLQARIDNHNDPKAMEVLAGRYGGGIGVPKDDKKAARLFRRAADLGLASAAGNLGGFYEHGVGVEKDGDEAKRLYTQAANGGDSIARMLLGNWERRHGNYETAIRHYKIAAAAGNQDAVDRLTDGYKCGHATKEELTVSLRAFQSVQDEISNEKHQRVSTAAKEIFKNK